MQSWHSAAILATSKLLLLHTHSCSGSLCEYSCPVCWSSPHPALLVVVVVVVGTISRSIDLVGRYTVVVDLDEREEEVVVDDRVDSLVT